MAFGGLLVKVHESSDLTLDTRVQLELVLPDGTSVQSNVSVLQVFAGFGVAVSVTSELIDHARRAANGVDPPGAGPARHERLDLRALPVRSRLGTPTSSPALRTPTSSSSPVLRDAPEATPERLPAFRNEEPTRSEKIQRALHGTRDERNAILRDRDRTLHPFVLKNPQLDAEDVVTIAKNAQVTPDLLKQIGDRKEWFQRPAVALALARNPKTPPEVAVRALEYVPLEALRQIAKGVGVPPHVTQAARKKILG